MSVYPATFFRQRPAVFDGKKIPGLQIINTSFAEGNVQEMREEIGILQRAGIKVVRDNELDLRADFRGPAISDALTRSAEIRVHLTQLATELSAAGIYFMPTLFHWTFGLDVDAAVIAAMPGGYPMTGATSLYNSLNVGAGAWSSSQNNKHIVRYFLIQMAIFGDGGTYAGAAGAKPGANRTTALGGDPLIDAIWAWLEADAADWASRLDPATLKIWFQMLNGPENAGELTTEFFWELGYFGNNTSDLKQLAANTIARNCQVHFPHTTANPNPEASQDARDTLCHNRALWAAKRLSIALYGDQSADNVILHRSIHRYDRKWRHRFVGAVPNQYVDECNISRPFLEGRDDSDDDRNSANTTPPRIPSSGVNDDDFDADTFWGIRVKEGVEAILSVNGGVDTVTVPASATSAQLKAALRTLCGMTDDIETADDITCEYTQGPAADSGDTTPRCISTQYEVVGGYATRGYHVRIGGISGASTNSKSKFKKAPFQLTSHNATPTDCVITQWVKGGEVDRGRGMALFVKHLVEDCDVDLVIIHAPVFSGAYTRAIWVFGDSATAGTWEHYRTNGTGAGYRSRMLHVAGPMNSDEPLYYKFIFNGRFARYMEQFN